MAAVGMYKMDPILDLNMRVDVPVPFCMYSMTPIAITKPIGPKESVVQSASPVVEAEKFDELDAVVARQRRLLQNLVVLQKRLEELRGQADPEKTETQVEVKKRDLPSLNLGKMPRPKTENVRSIVIRCHPSRPPHSVLDILGLLAKDYRVTVRTHVHSSVRNHPALRTLRSFNLDASGSPGHTTPALSVTVIWFDVALGCDMCINPLDQQRIAGESNLARYLYRIVPGNEYTHSSDPGTSCSIDVALDELDRWFAWTDKVEKNAIAAAKKLASDPGTSRLVAFVAGSYLKNARL